MEPTREQWYQRRIAELEAQVRQRDERIADLQRPLAHLAEQVAKLSKNSSNSSKPPSSDIVKPPKPPPPRGQRKRPIGGQPGHPRHEREAVTPEPIDQTRVYSLDRCPDCGGRLQPLKGPARVIQQVEIVRKPVTITEPRAGSYRCTHCGKTHTAPMPPRWSAAGGSARTARRSSATGRASVTPRSRRSARSCGT